MPQRSEGHGDRIWSLQAISSPEKVEGGSWLETGRGPAHGEGNGSTAAELSVRELWAVKKDRQRVEFNRMTKLPDLHFLSVFQMRVALQT